MPKIREVLEAFHYNPDTFNETEFKTAILAAYEEESGTWTAAVEAKDGELAAVQDALKGARAENWDLFKKLGTPIAPENAGGSIVPPTPDTDPNEPALKGTGSFFTKIE